MRRTHGHRPSDADSPSTIRERGASGAALLTAQAAAAQVVAFAGTLALAHLLVPRAFGLVAFGATVVIIGNFFADGGLGASLIRQSTDPTTAELRALLGLQLIVGCVLALGIAAVGLQAGTAGGITALMASSLPLLALRAPHAIVLERALRYGRIASIELTESVAYYLWAIATVWAGWDVWGLASAAITRALVGSVLITLASPLGVIWPRLSPGTLRPMLGFGIGFQAVGLAALARNQGVNLVIAAGGGAQLLGYWSLASRLLLVPFWLFQALWRVSYPTMARLRAMGEDTSLTVEHLACITALVAGAALAPLAASAHDLVPAIFGSRWATAADPIPWACAGLAISGPISVAAAGYLYSERDVATPLRATIVNGLVWVGLTAVLVGPVGVAAAGVGWMIASWSEATIFSRALRLRARVAVFRLIALPVAAVYASSILAYALPLPTSNQLIAGIVRAAVALAVYLVLNLGFNRATLSDTLQRMRSLVQRWNSGRSGLASPEVDRT
jgi:O-antigen/teichoic acid export membrane protein